MLRRKQEMYDPYQIPSPPKSRYVLLAIAFILCIGSTGVVGWYTGSMQHFGTQQQAVLSTPPYLQNLSSTNINLFLNAFADALAEQDIENIEQHTDVAHFIMDCLPDGTLPQGQSCLSDWSSLRQWMVADKMRLSFPQDVLIATQYPFQCQLPPGVTPDNGLVFGSFDNVTQTLPLSHLGQALFLFDCTTCGSETQWTWSAAYFC